MATSTKSRRFLLGIVATVWLAPMTVDAAECKRSPILLEARVRDLIDKVAKAHQERGSIPVVTISETLGLEIEDDVKALLARRNAFRFDNGLSRNEANEEIFGPRLARAVIPALVQGQYHLDKNQLQLKFSPGSMPFMRFPVGTGIYLTEIVVRLDRIELKTDPRIAETCIAVVHQ